MHTFLMCSVGLVLVLSSTKTAQAQQLVQCPYGSLTNDGRRFGDNVNANFMHISNSAWVGAGGYDDGTYSETGHAPIEPISLASVFPDGLPWFNIYSEAYLNVNGNLSFSQPNYSYQPVAIPGLSVPTIAPFFADVDLRATTTNTFEEGTVYVCEQPSAEIPWIAFTWWKVGRYNRDHSDLNYFQVILFNTEAICDGSFEVEFRYEQLDWHTGSVSNNPASAGFDSGDGSSALALPGSTTSAVIDLDEQTNTGETGVFRYMLWGAHLPQCGNSFLDGCEECDDGNDVSLDGCSSTCTTEFCGDDVVNNLPHEACDDGNSSNFDACVGCQLAVCGDGITRTDITNPATTGYEACDDADSNNNNGCLNNCRAAQCDDGFLWTGVEACDPAISPTHEDYQVGCSSDCLHYCGDGTRDAWEACDDGNNDNLDGCTGTCVVEYCGDGAINDLPDEVCDDGNGNDADACYACQDAYCGDGVRRTDIGVPSHPDYEGCDDGENGSNTDNCTAGCVAAVCGDGFLYVGSEDCDFNALEGELGYRIGCAGDCLSYCGDGNRDAGEGCDDGNNASGDGCTAECVPEVCGDGIWVAELEECDLGDENDNAGACTETCQLPLCGDGFVRSDLSPGEPGYEVCDPSIVDPLNPNYVVSCDANCQFYCGDGDTDAGESCDDENNLDDDGCSALCVEEYCGDGIVNDLPDEVCDDGDGDDQDACRNSCEYASCGDSVLRLDLAPGEPGYESCDDGNDGDEQDDCLTGCVAADCGDGYWYAAVEQCDPMATVGEPGYEIGCASDCTFYCGDGTQNPGEGCDDGNNLSGDGCNATCVPETCGDGILEVGTEECDGGHPPFVGDGTNDNNGACLLSCQLPTCGDGFLRYGLTAIDPGYEACDPAILDPLDPDYQEGCDSACQFYCGDGNTDVGEGCDDGGNVDGDGCSLGCVVEFCGDDIVNNLTEECDDGADGDDTDECLDSCATAICGDGVTRVDILDPANPLFEGCDDGNDGDNTDACLDGCSLPGCGDGFLQIGVEVCDTGTVDGELGYQVGCASDCSFYCGNGVRDAGEGCDDGNNLGGDGCTAECTAEACGDAVRVPETEECDLGAPPLVLDGDNDNNGACLLSCELPTCGDGYQRHGLEPTDIGYEACDPGIVSALDPDYQIGCDATCQFYCGDTNTDAGEGCDDGNNDSFDGCSSTCVDEYCGDEIVNDTSEECDDGLDGDENDECLSSCLNASCGDGFLRTDLLNPDAPGFELCDTGIVDDSNPDYRMLCSVDCQTYCGDGLVNGAEECDDGNNLSHDGCSALCLSEFCGDAVINGIEECDDGQDGDDKDECFDTCITATCGDGVLRLDLSSAEEGYEACDTGITDVADPDFRVLCPDTCGYFCGDENVDLGETCDDGNNVGADGCNPLCQLEICGDGFTEGIEECDDGNLTNDDGCTECMIDEGYVCTDGTSVSHPSECFDTCGNGVLDAIEECDDWNTENGDGCSDICEVENGWLCLDESGKGDIICEPVCGDGWLVGHELCDDGNEESGDGCFECEPEPGFVCGELEEGAQTNECNPTCGNGLLDADEACDDGGVLTGDGCDDNCQIEFGFTCVTEIGESSHCTLDCGNGSLDTYEECDDGNTLEGDGCDDICRVENGYVCDGVCSTICGDGIRSPGEACDDGNEVGGDGCTLCTVDDGWTCTDVETGSNCDEDPYCGDAIRQDGEQCEDGNLDDGDGCSIECEFEEGWECWEDDDRLLEGCNTICGDGLVVGDEECDDGNEDRDDGCASCNVSNGWVCDDSEPSECSFDDFCGDGILDAGEDCDDGNTDQGDGCSAACDVEEGWACDDVEPTDCLPDGDNDRVVDADDNCADVSNPDQEDLDEDGIGDACDDDVDGDGMSNALEEEQGTDPMVFNSTNGSTGFEPYLEPGQDCQCTATNSNVGLWGLLLFAIVFVWRRRRPAALLGD